MIGPLTRMGKQPILNALAEHLIKANEDYNTFYKL